MHNLDNTLSRTVVSKVHNIYFGTGCFGLSIYLYLLCAEYICWYKTIAISHNQLS